MMNSKIRRALLLACCAVMLVAMSVGATLAYLTSTDTVTNTFTVGKVAITLDEADVKPDGTYESTVDARVEANEYKLFPGRTYIKDPVVHVGPGELLSEDCYLFVRVTNEITAIEDKAATIFAQMEANGWYLINGTAEDGIYCFGTTADGTITPTVVADGANVPVFANFKVADDVADVMDYEEAEVKIEAYAIQADGFAGKTPVEIYKAGGWAWVVEP